MRGPYEVHIETDGDTLVFEDPDQIINDPIVQSVAYQYYGNGADYTMRGTERAACIYAAIPLLPGERAVVKLFGTQWTYRSGALRAKKTRQRVEAARHTVRRDEGGMVYMTLGSKFNERAFDLVP